jgi:hypothetical protein
MEAIAAISPENGSFLCRLDGVRLKKLYSTSLFIRKKIKYLAPVNVQQQIT